MKKLVNEIGSANSTSNQANKDKVDNTDPKNIKKGTPVVDTKTGTIGITDNNGSASGVRVKNLGGKTVNVRPNDLKNGKSKVVTAKKPSPSNIKTIVKALTEESNSNIEQEMKFLATYNLPIDISPKYITEFPKELSSYLGKIKDIKAVLSRENFYDDGFDGNVNEYGISGTFINDEDHDDSELIWLIESIVGKQVQKQTKQVVYKMDVKFLLTEDNVYTRIKLLEQVVLKENIKTAKQFVQSGKLSQEDFDKIVKIDPTTQKKYAGWLAKVWITDKPDINTLRNSIEEYDTLLQKNRVKTKDIYKFKNFDEFKSEIDHINNTGDNLSLKELETDFEVILNTPDVYIACPHTHEASRKLGLTTFKFRICKNEAGEETGNQDSAWCTTVKAPDHFNSYYYSRNLTFYYIKIKSEKYQEILKNVFPTKWKPYTVIALTVDPNGKYDAYDANDDNMPQNVLMQYLKLMHIDDDVEDSI